MSKVRVRFAPSPTGQLHVGGVRSALFNWLWAKHNGGVFMLRIEDTDRQRYVDDAIPQIKESLEWVGLSWDEFETQSERLARYKEAANELVEKGSMYPCWCSPERLADLRKQAQKAKVAFKYDRHCLKSPGDIAEAHVLRFKIPEQPNEIEWDDAVRGKLSFAISDQDDFVALKSDGFPTYNFANVVDDHDMEISDVIRADEFIASTPKHLLVYKAFSWDPPIFAHLPAVQAMDKTGKLSKRHGAKSVLDYRDEGYLPEATINFLALLGWNPGEGSTKEIYTIDELTKAFTLDHVQSSPAAFDPDRLEWMNGLYIRNLPLDELDKRAERFWPKAALEFEKEYRHNVLALLQERLKFLAELPLLSEFFFTEPQVDSGTLTKNVSAKEAAKLLEEVAKALSDNSFKADDLEQALRQLAEKLDVKTGQLFGLIRAAVTGSNVAPPLFDTLAVLGRGVVMARLKTATSLLD